ncbi:SMI1/KNR4 family protein [Nocardia sp. 2]|uniref:SMI1/KNR4 family protein n=1 Tax=Nocardia acididurans TaxID=2802282 RepID=A0ABS1MHC6_9NOCA|nr:SMI1/KNR4 family protein [Nocardia acididurans]MBL1079440.1 SMI1/KNR4 family protein [Nocardia acididurans]
MGRPVDLELWRELIERLVEQKRRLVAYRSYESDTQPKAGASEEELCAAESRLGRRLDPQYRDLLSVANGWDHFWITESLLGTEDICVGRRWEMGVTQADEWFADSNWGVDLGAPDDPGSYQLVVENDNGYSGNLYLFVGVAPGLPTGATVPLPLETTYPDLYSYFRDQLERMTDDADQLALGEYSEPWRGRNIRADPPTMAEIVARIAELIRSGNPGNPEPVRDGATAEELDLLDRALSGTLHPEHRELLSVSNGLATPHWGLGDVLSVQDILDGGRWREGLARMQTKEYPQYGPPPLLERIGYLPAVPFAMSPTTFYGVDLADGCVRDLLQDGDYFAKYGERPLLGRTVREHLLKGCWDLWWTARPGTI